MIHASIPPVLSVESATAVFISTWDPRSWPQLYPDSRLAAPGTRSGVQRCTSFQRCLPSSAMRSVAETLVVDDETTLRNAATSSRRHGASSSDSLLARVMVAAITRTGYPLLWANGTCKGKGSSVNAQQAIHYPAQMMYHPYYMYIHPTMFGEAVSH